MLGKHSPQGELFRPDSMHLDHVGRKSLYGFLAQYRHQLFRDEDFRDLYHEENGRPSVPPSQLCIALILQTREGVSDEEAIHRSAFDLRWKVALGIDLEEKLCAKSTLQLFRAKLILHEQYEKLFHASIDACRKQGLLKSRKIEVALDTTPIFGRGAVKDTFNLISDQIRTVIDAVVQLKDLDREALIQEQGLGRHFASSFKGQAELNWDDQEEKRALVGQLVADAKVALALGQNALRGYSRTAEKTEKLRAALKLLADLLLQDIEEDPEDGGGPAIKKGTDRDRIVSTTDTEMRHGRKSETKTFTGHKAAVAVDTEEGIILATEVIPGNAHDSEGAAQLAAEAGKAAGCSVEAVLGDTAYGSTATREAIIEATGGAEVIAKTHPVSKRKGVALTVEDFEIDLQKNVATCPTGKPSIRTEAKGDGRIRFHFSRKDCTGCPLRSDCTTAEISARTVTVSEDYEELRARRREQRTDDFKQKYRQRVKVEHRIARLIQLGVRQARYFGRAKTAFQVAIAAAVANLGMATNVALGLFLALLRGLKRLPGRTGRFSIEHPWPQWSSRRNSAILTQVESVFWRPCKDRPFRLAF